MSINVNVKKGTGTVEKSALQVNTYGDTGGSGDLPIASADTLGGVKVGEGLSIDSDGVLSASGGILIVPIYSDEGTAKCDVTYSEIRQAVIDGKAVFGVGDAGSYQNQWYTFILSSVTGDSCVFTATYLDAPLYTTATLCAIVIKIDNTLERKFFPLAQRQ